MISLNTTVIASQKPVFSNVGNEIVLLNPSNGNYYGLNALGARIWELLQKPMQVKQVLQIILDEYDVDPQECKDDLLELLGQLAEHDLIETPQ